MTTVHPRAFLSLGLLALATALTTALIGWLSPASGSAAGGGFTHPSEVAAQLRVDRQSVGGWGDRWEGEEALQPLVQDTAPAVYLVVMDRAGDPRPPRAHLLAIRRTMGVPGTYVGLYRDRLYAVSDDIAAAELSELLIEANGATDSVDRIDRTIGLVVKADELNGGTAVSPPPVDGSGEPGLFTYGLVVFLLAGLGVYIGFRTGWFDRFEWLATSRRPVVVVSGLPPRPPYIIEPSQEGWDGPDHPDDARHPAEDAGPAEAQPPKPQPDPDPEPPEEDPPHRPR